VIVAVGCDVGCWVFVGGASGWNSREFSVEMLLMIDVATLVCVGIMTVSISVLLGVVSLMLA
jgi:hypothetical protein